MLSVFRRKVSFHLNHSKIPKGNTIQVQVALEVNTWIKSKPVITLRSGTVIEKPILKPCEKDDEVVTKGKEGVEPEHCKENIDSLPALPIPHAITKQRKVNHNYEIFETFKQVRINIPLLDAIKQVPSYAKFLKDLYTVKGKLNVKKKAFLAE
jgi:hypothetical protein